MVRSRFAAQAVVGLALGLSLGLAPSLEVHAAGKKAKAAPKSNEGTITWKVENADVIIFLDGKKLGPAGKVGPQKVKAGSHVIKLMLGKDETEASVPVAAGQTVEFPVSFGGE